MNTPSSVFRNLTSFTRSAESTFTLSSFKNNFTGIETEIIINIYSLLGMIKHVYNVKLSQLDSFYLQSGFLKTYSVMFVDFSCTSFFPQFFISLLLS